MADVKVIIARVAPEDEALVMRLGLALIAHWDLLAADLRYKLREQAIFIELEPEEAVSVVGARIDDLLNRHGHRS